MPGMSGIELQRQLVASCCNIPVIFITAYEDEGMRAQAFVNGAGAFLIKPFAEEAFSTRFMPPWLPSDFKSKTMRKTITTSMLGQ